MMQTGYNANIVATGLNLSLFKFRLKLACSSFLGLLKVLFSVLSPILHGTCNTNLTRRILPDSREGNKGVDGVADKDPNICLKIDWQGVTRFVHAWRQE